LYNRADPASLSILPFHFLSDKKSFTAAGAVELWASAAWQIQQPRETGIPEQNK